MTNIDSDLVGKFIFRQTDDNEKKIPTIFIDFAVDLGWAFEFLFNFYILWNSKVIFILQQQNVRDFATLVELKQINRKNWATYGDRRVHFSFRLV